MRFYKLTDIETGQEVYINPKMIEYYMYHDDYVQIETLSMYMHVALLDFSNMMFLEGADEYWNAQHTIA